MKEVRYRGGLITFSIPDHWQEQYEPDGGGTFFDAASESITLRVNVVTVEAPSGIAAGELAPTAVGASSIPPSAVVERLASGNAIARYSMATEEAGNRLRIDYWHVAAPVPPNKAHVAIFSLTMLESEQDTSACRDLRELLDNEISAARLSDRGGASAGTKHKWWPFK